MEDGVRSTNEEFQLAIEELIVKKWSAYPGRKLMVEGGLDRRLETTMEYLAREIGDSRLSERGLPL